MLAAKAKALFTWKQLALADQITRLGVSLNGGIVPYSENLFTWREGANFSYVLLENALKAFNGFQRSIAIAT